jgi:hypothetical protein
VEAGANAAARKAVAEAAALAEAGAKQNFEGSHARGEPHVGGDKPNVVTGTLRRSIRADPIRRYGIADYGTVVAPRVAYARRVEKGYPGGGDGPGQQATRAFPYFEPAAHIAREQFRVIAAEQWRRFLLHP